MRRVQETIRACDLPREAFARLIEANRMDQSVHRYATWDDVRWYCTHSAEPVGRLVLGIYGRLGEPELVAMSDDVCTGLQLTNFLQDPPRDYALGRIYLPQEDLMRFDVAERDFASAGSDNLVELMRFEAERARSLLEPGVPLGRVIGGRAGASVALFARGGLAALEALERAGWDVFSGRPAPSKWTFARLTVAQLFRR